MMLARERFNLYLLVAAGLAMLCSCKTPEEKMKTLGSTLRVHMETNPYSSGRTEVVPIFRQNPISITIDKMPFLSESDVSEAKVVNTLGGFALHIQFNREGMLLLEEFTGANRGKHMAIFSQFATLSDSDHPTSGDVRPAGDPHSAGVTNASGHAHASKKEKHTQGRWLGAPRINQHISDGALIFTPDATREEAEQIAIGLNNVVRKAHGKKNEE